MTHSTQWEDAGFAGVACDGKDTDLTLDAESLDTRTCPVCGKKLRLMWHVEIIEVP